MRTDNPCGGVGRKGREDGGRSRIYDRCELEIGGMNGKCAIKTHSSVCRMHNKQYLGVIFIGGFSFYASVEGDVGFCGVFFKSVKFISFILLTFNIEPDNY